MRKLEEFWFRYFSESTLNTKDCWVRYVVALILAFPYIVGILLDILGMDYTIPVLIGVVLMVCFAALWITVWFYHENRLK
jgi:hypothetical protein